MKNTVLIIVIVVQAFLLLLVGMYAFVQKGVAKENLREAEHQYERAELRSKEAAELRKKLENCR